MPIRFTSDDIQQMIEHSEDEEESFVASDEDSYLPQLGNASTEESDIEHEVIVECQDQYESNESAEHEPISQSIGSILIGKDGTQWYTEPLPSLQTKSRNVLYQRGGPALNCFSTEKELFISIITPEICDIVLRESNRKAKRVCEAFNNKLLKFPNCSVYTIDIRISKYNCT